MDYWRKKSILPVADLACKIPVLFLLQLEKTSRLLFPVCAFPQADVRPQTDGCNGLRYNLTSDIIESIFRTYPAGKSSVYIPNTSI